MGLLHRKQKEMPEKPDYEKQAEEIAERHVVIAELQDYLDENNLEEGEKLNFRLLKRLYVNDIKTDLILEPVIKHTEECAKNPSIIWLLRNKALATISQLFVIAALFYFFFRVIETITGLGGILELLTP